MARMMPGRVRQEGIELYEAGKLSVEKSADSCLFFKVDAEDFCYALDEEKISCSCDLFAQRAYCPHLAAVEYYLKNDADGKETIETLSRDEAKEEERERRTYFGGLFLDKVLPGDETLEVRYQLSVEGQLLLYDQNIDWTLKISRLPDSRSYIIRDIGAFLKIVKKGSSYQIGKNYYEKLSYAVFDDASQGLLDFLWRIIPEKSVFESEVFAHFGRHLRLPLAFFEDGLDLLQQLASFEFHCDDEKYDTLRLVDFDARANLYRFSVEVDTQVIELKIEEKPKRELLSGRYFLVGNCLYQVDAQQDTLLKTVKDILSKDEQGRKTVQVDFQDRDKLALSLLEFKKIGTVSAPKRFEIQDFQPQFRLDKGEDNQLLLQLSLAFPNCQVSSQEELQELAFAYHYQHLQGVYRFLDHAGFRGQFKRQRTGLSSQDWYQFFVQTLPAMKRFGQVDLSDDLRDVLVEEATSIQVDRSGSLLDVSFDFAGIEADEVEDALEALMSAQAYFTSRTGRLLVFDDELKRVSQTLTFLRAKSSGQGSMTLSSLASYQLADAFSGQDHISFTESFRTMAYELAHPEAVELPALPIQANLRDYQQLGVHWLSTLDKYGFGGILADDMGLGKTLQSIAFIASHTTKDSRVLILAPSSLIYNWQEECHKFAPQLDVAVIYGNKAERERLLEEDHQVVVTSYASFRQDVALYKAQSYDYLFLDEAQVMKNSQTKIAQQLREFEVGNCFALSGTPIENNLNEIWSIFQIVLPGLLPAKLAFGKLAAEDVARIIRPFILCRKKEDVLEELPDLIEVNVLNELSDDQKVIYLAQLRQIQARVASASEAEINRQKIEILSGITRLRQICDTPKLFMDDFDGESGKLENLKELLIQLKEGNHRVLIFSQFKQMLDIIEKELDHLGLSSYKLTGSTPTHLRQEMTTAFNTGSRDAFLISLKAGGVGLNLTGADTVILIDLWWNPAAEQQAISRAHRMGQTETVEFYRMITRGTIEEKIQELQENKKNLVTTVLDGNESRASLTVDDIREILGLS
ncbi:superfamily II DNA or RNA helicase [Streptococcus gallinaceus]|uniref:DEAD/DEAH box helicase n=1 Tax=Streptococcus gallinaceus TaxID=165758 RepID=UPI00209E97FD|nr:SNF2-related protein [Streptococcus gallinaceus]MCP1639828.1 superfamily II DNA or RNA helicase [Streptococcus gallinaceus]MCP1770610.1 superfamily II DNA or RNA helicase [Streptococcus gallinaceus]